MLPSRGALNTSTRCELLGQLSGLTGWTCLVGDAWALCPCTQVTLGLSCVLLASEVFA